MQFLEDETIIEAVLFASGEPVHIKKIAEVLNTDTKVVRLLMKSLSDKYFENKRGFIIIEIEDSFQMCTNPEHFEYIKDLFLSPQKKKLTQALLETLAIIAYKQPVTKPEIEDIRGVSAEHSINKLIEYNLVCEKGRRETPGKPILFGTTDEFLKYYGYSGLDRLPVIEFPNAEADEVSE